jgi:hypothetical protein
MCFIHIVLQNIPNLAFFNKCLRSVNIVFTIISENIPGFRSHLCSIEEVISEDPEDLKEESEVEPQVVKKSVFVKEIQKTEGSLKVNQEAENLKANEVPIDKHR